MVVIDKQRKTYQVTEPIVVKKGFDTARPEKYQLDTGNFFEVVSKFTHDEVRYARIRNADLGYAVMRMQDLASRSKFISPDMYDEAQGLNRYSGGTDYII